MISSLCWAFRFENASRASFSQGSEIPGESGRRIPPLQCNKEKSLVMYYHSFSTNRNYSLTKYFVRLKLNILPAKLSKILRKPSPGESGIGAAEDITCSTSSSNENCFMYTQGLFKALELFIAPTVLKLHLE